MAYRRGFFQWYGDRSAKPIKVGHGGQTLYTGPRRSKYASAVCDLIGEYLYEVVHAVLFKFGGYEEDDFQPMTYGRITGVYHCTDSETKHYAQDVIVSAREAMKSGKLRCFEVSIVDGLDFPLVTFSVQFRRQPKFKDCSMFGKEKEMEDLMEQFGISLRNILNMPLGEEMRAKVEQTETRLQIRLQVTEEFVENAGYEMERDSKAAMLPHAKFVPWGDTVTNLFNQLVLSSIISCNPPSTDYCL